MIKFISFSEYDETLIFFREKVAIKVVICIFYTFLKIYTFITTYRFFSYIKKTKRFFRRPSGDKPWPGPVVSVHTCSKHNKQT